MQSPPRKLTTHQKAVLIHVLIMFPDQRAEICYSPAAPDALAYAHDFLAIFKAVGWTVNDAEPAEIAATNSAGLTILLSRQSGPFPGAEALRDTLRIYSIEVETLADSTRKIAPGTFALFIGSPI
jgi:hypothetical protein